MGPVVPPGRYPASQQYALHEQRLTSDCTPLQALLQTVLPPLLHKAAADVSSPWLQCESCACVKCWYSCTAKDQHIDHNVIDSVTGEHYATFVVCWEPHWPYIDIYGLPCWVASAGSGQSGSGSGLVRASGFQRSAANRAKQDPQVQLPCHCIRHGH